MRIPLLWDGGTAWQATRNFGEGGGWLCEGRSRRHREIAAAVMGARPRRSPSTHTNPSPSLSPTPLPPLPPPSPPPPFPPLSSRGSKARSHDGGMYGAGVDVCG